MTLNFDLIRNRKRGEEARERVMQRVYGGGLSTENKEDDDVLNFDAIRNRSVDKAPSNSSPTVTTSQPNPDIGMVQPLYKINANIATQLEQRRKDTMYNPVKELEKLKNPIQPKAAEPKAQVTAPFGTPEYDLQLLNKTRENLGFSKDFKISESEYEKRMRRLENAPPGVKQVGEYLTGLFYDTPAGKFVVNSLPSDPRVVNRESTGSNVADNISNVLNAVSTPLLTPTGAPLGSGPLAAPINASERLLLTKGGQAVENAIAKPLQQVARPATAQKIAGNLITGSTAGAVQGFTDAAMRGEDDKDMLRSIALGAGLGGAIDAALPALGAGLSKLKGAKPSVNAPGSAALPGGQNLGIAAGVRKPKPYDQLKTDTKSQLTSRMEREPINVGRKVDKLYTRFVDDLHPINRLDKLTESIIGDSLKASDSPYKLALGSRGADVVAKQIVTDKLVDSAGNVVGESLKDVLSQLPKKAQSYVDFEDYLINKHAITRAARGEKVFRDELNWTPEAGAQKLADYEKQFPEFKEMSEKLYEFNKNMVNKWLVDTGMITPEQANAWFEANPYYVPNKRQFSELEKGSGGRTRANSGFGNQSVPVKKYGKGGSQRKIISPIEAIIENVDAFVKSAKRNEVMQKLVQNIERSPEAFADYAEIVKQPGKPSNVTETLLTGDGIDEVLAGFSDDFDKSMMKTKLDKDNIVRVLIGGEPVHLKINDPELLNAITSLGPENGNIVLDTIGKLTNAFKVLTTGNNPIFSFTRNLFRDIPQAYIASKTTGNPVSFAADLVSAAIDIGMKRGAYKDFLNVGGGHSSPIAADRNLLKRSKASLLPSSKNPLKGAVPKLYRKYEDFMNVAEMAPRLAEFKRTAKQSGDLQKALYAAQDVTTNFKRRGSVVRELDKVFPYMNAALQGLDQVVRVYKDNPVKALTKSAMALSIPSMVLYAVNHDDPNYQKVSRKTKDAFFLIPKGDGTFIKIAKPQEQGTIFSDIPERLMQLFQEEDPNAFKDFADRLRTTFLPPGIQGAAKKGGITDRLLGVVGDTILGPIADVAANKNFADSPIVPGYLENLSPELQYDAKTTNVAKWLGEKTGTSPKQLDYLGRQYTGVIGQIAQPLLSPGGDLGSALSQQMTVDPVFSNDITNEFYAYKSKLDEAFNNSDLKPLPSWYDDPLRKEFNKISKNMSAIRKDIRAVQGDTKLSNAEKREKLRSLQEEVNKLAEMGNNFAREAKIPY